MWKIRNIEIFPTEKNSKNTSRKNKKWKPFAPKNLNLTHNSKIIRTLLTKRSLAKTVLQMRLYE